MKDFRTTAIVVRRVTATPGSKTTSLGDTVVNTTVERVKKVRYYSSLKKLRRHPTLWHKRAKTVALYEFCCINAHSEGTPGL